jgi:hypothetical protein
MQHRLVSFSPQAMARAALAFSELLDLIVAPAQIRAGFRAWHIGSPSFLEISLGPKAYGEVTP